MHPLAVFTAMLKERLSDELVFTVDKREQLLCRIYTLFILVLSPSRLRRTLSANNLLIGIISEFTSEN